MKGMIDRKQFGPWALITGASSGIGREFARQIAASGVNKVERCVSEGLKALRDNRSLIIPGRTNRILNALVPASVTRSMMAKMFEKTLADRAELAKT